MRGEGRAVVARSSPLLRGRARLSRGSSRTPPSSRNISVQLAGCQWS